MTSRYRYIVLAAALAAIAWTAPLQAKVWSNTQVRLPDNAYLGDINGDGNQDFVYARGGAVYVTYTDPWDSKILYSLLSPDSPIARVFTGDFQGVGADQICALHTDGLLSCWAASWDRTTMDWWFTQWSFIGDDEHVIVGNFDGDERDDFLVYNPSTGQVRHFVTLIPGFFGENPSFQLGNLDPPNLINKQLYAGEFGQAIGQTDLVVYDRASKQVSRLDSINWDSARPTFWWAFTTDWGFVGNEMVAVANIEGSDQDDLVLRDIGTGAYRFFRVEWDWTNWNLSRIDQDPGQLPVEPATSGVTYWLRNRGWYDWWSNRDDQMFYRLSAPRAWSSTHARVWDNALYYWGYFTKPALERVDGDANGDQRTDLAVLGNQTWGTMPLATSNGDGTFNETNTGNSDPGMNFTAWAATPGAKLVRGDFDGDGMSDLALVGGKFRGTMPVAFSKGDGSYRVKNEAITDFQTWASRPNVTAVTGDFDYDLKSDIALVGEVGRYNIPVAYSRGDGTFDVLEVALGGFADLAAFRDFNSHPSVWPKVVAADFNNDHRCDIALVGGVDSASVPVAFSLGKSFFSFEYLNLTGGTSETNSFHSRAKEPGTHAVAGDFDGNTLPDLALVGGSAGQTDITFALNYGDGQFYVDWYSSVQAPEFSAWAQEPGVKAVSGYFNDDTVADIALVGGVGWKTIRLALSNYGLSFSPTNVASTFGGQAAQPHVWPATNVASNAGRTTRSLDQDGDRLGDISLTGGVGWGTMPVAFSRANGDFKVENQGIDAEWASLAAHNGVSVLAGDYNGDGRADVALATPGFPRMVAFANGDGTFWVHKNGTTAGAPTGARVVAGDFNADGLTDIMSIGGFNGSNNQSLSSVLYQGYGDGDFLSYQFGAQANELAAYINSTTAGAQIVAGDFNGDGASDLAVMGGLAQDWVHAYFTVRQFGQSGDMFQRVSFQNPAIRTQLTSGGKVVAGDFDADGLDDLYFLRGSNSNLMVGLSQGTGAFAPVSVPAPNLTAMGMMGNFVDWSRAFYARPVVGDFNGDGASDLALTGGRDWKSVPVAFSPRRTDAAWLVHNPAVKDFPILAANTGAMPASEDPTNTVDTVAPAPPVPDPPSSVPTQTDVYIQSASFPPKRRWIDMPRNEPIAYHNAGWTFVFDICNDNDDDFFLGIEYVMVREYWSGVGNQWSVSDWWAQGIETYDTGTGPINTTAANYRGREVIASSYPYGVPPPPDTRPIYRLDSIPARGCKRMWIERPGGQGIGFWVFEVHVDEVEPIDNTDKPYASIALDCPESFNLACSVYRF